MSTLSEIAANHARMAKALAEESIEVSMRKIQIVGSFEVNTPDEESQTTLHYIDIPQEEHAHLLVAKMPGSGQVISHQQQAV
ncbi:MULTISPECIES: hypothetical protein [unclassified Pseudomonas]|uniref:hypothetical protein n=1 Tax=Pseudomonas sp. Ant30-3 TaxID=1488328 RepID=UPI0009DDE088|nr:hypothetical protein [Pseudomonas sp. Ant30-3]